jgi:soluble cytochrome b562
MLRRAVLGVAIVCLMAGAAYTQDETEGDNECTAQLTAAEEKVHDKIESNALSEADAEKVNELLDEADALCTEGKFDEASATLATVNQMVGN